MLYVNRVALINRCAGGSAGSLLTPTHHYYSTDSDPFGINNKQQQQQQKPKPSFPSLTPKPQQILEQQKLQQQQRLQQQQQQHQQGGVDRKFANFMKTPLRSPTSSVHNDGPRSPTLSQRLEQQSQQMKSPFGLPNTGQQQQQQAQQLKFIKPFGAPKQPNPGFPQQQPQQQTSFVNPLASFKQNQLDIDLLKKQPNLSFKELQQQQERQQQLLNERQAATQQLLSQDRQTPKQYQSQLRQQQQQRNSINHKYDEREFNMRDVGRVRPSQSPPNPNGSEEYEPEEVNEDEEYEEDDEGEDYGYEGGVDEGDGSKYVYETEEEYNARVARKAKLKAQKEIAVADEEFDKIFNRMTAREKLEKQHSQDREELESRLQEVEDSETIRRKRQEMKEQKKEQDRKDPAKKRSLMMPLIPSPKGLSSLIGISTVEILKWMIRMGEKPTRSDLLMTKGMVELLGTEYNFEPQWPRDKSEMFRKVREQDPNWPFRAPVVTVVGHIDHGKTSLLDYLRNTNVVEKEAGRITQHIGAFEVDLPTTEEKITFMDTPGHAAFSQMRIRGVSTTDIAILIVAVDDGVQEQTIEAIKAITNAKIPFIVAINKIDKIGADKNMVINQLMEHGVMLDGHGGETPYVEISALTGQGIDKLEETIVFLSKYLDLKAPVDGDADGIVIESTSIAKRGVSATVLVKNGTLKVGSYFVCGDTYGKVRELRNHKGELVKEAGPSTPIDVQGFNKVAPKPGDEMFVVDTEKKALEIVTARAEKRAQEQALLAAQSKNDIIPEDDLKKTGKYKRYKPTEIDDKLIKEELREKLLDLHVIEEKKATTKMANLYLKADVGGSIEALQFAMKVLPEDEEMVYNVARTSVGDVTEGDLKEIALLKSPLCYFGPPLPTNTVEAARKLGIPVIQSDVIYHVVEGIKAHLETRLEPVTIYKVSGEAKVLQTFTIDLTNKTEIVAAGCNISSGVIKKGNKVRVKRGDDIIYDGKVEILKHFKEMVKEVKKGQDCGICMKDFDGTQEGDIIFAYTTDYETRKLGERVDPIKYQK